jgi:CheY-like chemotaxis protein
VHVLVVDDCSAVRARLVALLGEGDGDCTIEEASDAAEALAAARARPPALVILDLNLPGPSGLDVLPRLKAGPAPPVVVVLTNHPTDPHRRQCLALGADHFFDKSHEFDRVVAVLHETCASRS